MIENLNRLSIQPYGVTLPDMPDQTGWEQPWQTLHLTDDGVFSQKTCSQTWLTCESGMAVLSLSTDGITYFDCYLDKSVRLDPGVYFSLSAFLDQAVIRYAAPQSPQPLQQTRLRQAHPVLRQLRIEKLYTLFYQEKETGFLFCGESHPVVELTYVDQGSLHSVADGQDILLEQGELMLYAPEQWHMQYADIGVAPRFMTLTFSCDSDLSDLYNRKFSVPQKAISLLQQILQEHDRMDAFSGDVIINLLCLLLITLKRCADRPADPLKSTHCITNENEIIRRAQQYISCNVRSRLTVPLVARNSDVSTSYLTALFHKHLQISPGEYIRRIKLQESKQMIREGTMNFTEIAQALEYSTIHHFSRQFKEKFGITPSQYAKSIR